MDGAVRETYVFSVDMILIQGLGHPYSPFLTHDEGLGLKEKKKVGALELEANLVFVNTLLGCLETLPWNPCIEEI